MKKKFLHFTYFLCLIFLGACHTKNAAEPVAEEVVEAITPVTVAAISVGPMESFIDLNATSVYRQKWIVRSNLNGYLQNTSLQLNKMVSKGQSLFVVKTKEAQSIGNTISLLDPSFKFSGVNNIRSNGSGFVAEINHQPGDYVQDGEQLAVVTDTRSFVFLLDLPYNLRPFIMGKKSVQITLPDNEKLEAFVTGNMPAMDSISQTQRIILKVKSKHLIPENLIAKVRLVKQLNPHATFVPKAAVLADETQTNFWVMKLVNDSLAAKVVIKKGIEAGDNIEIISPVFSAQDKILLTGNYALSDTAKVKVLSSTLVTE